MHQAVGPDPQHAHAAIEAQAELHHALLLGLQLAVSMDHDSAAMERWMFALFRRQHHEKFLASFAKLGLTGLPHAVACARYHVLSNGIGGVPVEYMEESDSKAWVRFRYPRWMFAGPTLCGLPVGVSRGFLRGWYAHNGVSLGNPRLGFVCVSEDMTGEFGFCGYFREFDTPLAPEQRLQFARHELPPPYDPDRQPTVPAEDWTPERLLRAKRNYAVAYIRNGLVELARTLGQETAQQVGCRAARLTGLQYYPATAHQVAATDGDARDARAYLAKMFAGMGDEVRLVADASSTWAAFQCPRALRVCRGLVDTERDLVASCWQALWQGTIQSHRMLLDLRVRDEGEAGLRWEVRARRPGDAGMDGSAAPHGR